MMKCLVTGATGFVGSHLVDTLLQTGASVRAYVRHGSDTRRLIEQDVALVVGDENDRAAMQRAVAGMDVVIHAAAYVPVDAPFAGKDQNVSDGDWARYFAVNVDFTESLLSASLAAGNGRFLFVSSNSVYAPDAPVPTPEDAKLGPVSAYGRSKLLAEEAVRTFQARGLDATIVRPALIYGPGDRTFTPLALRLARLPILPLVSGGRALLDLVYVRDVAQLIRLAAFHKQAVGKVYNAGPGRTTSLADLVQAYRRETGRGPRILAVSPQAALRTSWLSRRLVQLLLPGTQAALSPLGIALLTRDMHLSMERAARELDFQPHYDLLAGLRQTLAGAAL